MLGGWARLFERIGLGRPAAPVSIPTADSAPLIASLREPVCTEVRLTAARRDLLLRASDAGAIIVTENARNIDHAKRLRASARVLEASGYVTLSHEPGSSADGRHHWYRLTLRLTPAGEALVARTRRQLDKGIEVRWRRIRAEGGLTIPPA